MRKAIFLLFSTLIFLLPLVFTRYTQQIFEINKFSLLLVFTGVIAVLFAIYQFGKTVKLKRINKNQRLVLSAFALFGLSLIISTLLSVSPVGSFWGSYFRHEGLITFLCVFLLSLIAVSLNPNRKELIYFFISPLILTGIAESLIVIFQNIAPEKMFGDLQIKKYLSRSIGTFGQPNFTGRFLLFPFFTLLPFVFLEPKKYKITKKVVIVFCLILMLLSVLATGSRAAMVGLATGLLIFSGTKSAFKKSWKTFFVTLGLIIIACIGILFAYGNSFEERNAAVDMRLLIWQQSPLAIIQKPVFGWGPDMQEDAISKIAKEDLAISIENTVLDRAHNEIIDFGIQIGILGLIFYLLFLYLSVHVSSENLKKEPLLIGIFSAIIASFVGRQFGFFSITENFYFFLLLLLLVFYGSKDIFVKKTKRKSPAIYCTTLAAIGIGIFLLYASYNIWTADKLYFQGKTEISYSKTPWNKVYGKKAIVESLNNKDFETSEKNLSILEKYQPNWAETHYLKALYYYQAVDLDNAFESIKKSLELYPGKEKYIKFKQKIIDNY